MKKNGLFKTIFASLLGIACIGAATTATVCVVSALPAYAEEEPTAECRVVLPVDVKGGTVEADILEGNVGDVVTLIVEHDFFYAVSSVSVNGISLVPGEQHTYSFQLVSGDNVVSVAFEINSEIISKFADLYAKLRAGNWEEVFNIQNLLLLLNWLLDCGIGIALVRVLSKYKKLKKTMNETIGQEVANFEAEINKAVPASVVNILKDMSAQVFTPLLEKMSSVEENERVLSRCFALMQENTPESRAAILDLLSQSKISDVDLLNEVKSFIADQLKEIKSQYEKQLQTLAEVKELNSAPITPTESGTDKPSEDLVDVEIE